MSSPVLVPTVVVPTVVVPSVDVVVVRPFNHIGPGQDVGFFAPAFARQLARIEAGIETGPMRVGNLTPRRDLCDVRDTVRAYRLLMEHGSRGEIYNVCSGEAVEIGALLDMLRAQVTTPVDVMVDPSRLRPVDMPLLVGDRTALAVAQSQRDQLQARIGYAAKGVVYLAIGLVAIRAAVGAATPAGYRGAVLELLKLPVGALLVGAVAAGLLGYAGWRLVRAFANPEHDRWYSRVYSAATAVVHITVFVGVLGILLGSRAARRQGEGGERCPCGAGCGRRRCGTLCGASRGRLGLDREIRQGTLVPARVLLVLRVCPDTQGQEERRGCRGHGCLRESAGKAALELYRPCRSGR